MVSLLVKNGADTNRRSTAGMTPLYTAATEEAQGAALQRLLERGANPPLPANDGSTPLSVARARQEADKVTLLQKYLRAGC